MSVKTLTELRRSVRTLYGDPDGVTATDTEVDDLLKDGVNRVLADCPWLYVQLDSTEALTTDAVGGALLSNHNIGQMYSVEIDDGSSSWRRLQNVQPGLMNIDLTEVTTVTGIIGYYMDGHRIQFYPMYRSGNLTIRILYSSGSIGAQFPSVAGNALPVGFPPAAEEAAIRHAVARLHMRDNNFEAAGFIDGDAQQWILKLHVLHNRPERGETLRVYDRDYYDW